MIELGKVFLPLKLDYKPGRHTITLRTPEYQTADYIFDSECNLQLNFSGTVVFIDYWCEDQVLLSELFELETGNIASGDLTAERFATIQERALKVLQQHIGDPWQEIQEHFEGL